MLATTETKLRWWGIDMRPRWRRRVSVVVTYAVLISLTVLIGGLGEMHPLLAIAAVAIATGALRAISVFRNNGLVKSFEETSFNRIGKYVVVGSLDEWARYRYGVADFEGANNEQQAELLSNYHVGNRLVPSKTFEDCSLDERERKERDSICRWALNRVAFCLAISAGVSANWKHIEPIEISVFFLMFCLLSTTLPQARVLWTEPAPHELGDLSLARNEA